MIETNYLFDLTVGSGQTHEYGTVHNWTIQRGSAHVYAHHRFALVFLLSVIPLLRSSVVNVIPEE
jgi:hypothetical protein